jgi:Uma2 family endonuclease
MTVLPPHPSPDKMSTDAFLAMIGPRPREERWQLIDGEPFLMMSPPTLVHQRIALNLAAALNNAIETARPDLFALVEVGLIVDAHKAFRPIADVAVLDAEIDSVSYATRFHLVAEILSPSNSLEHISRKRALYADAPDCLHVLIIGQDDVCLELWSRAENWQGRVFRSAEDVITLPEFGFSCRLGDLYKGTPVR